jgi:sigma-B regulation protein RsbU (phosphoserine phosphatase)
MTGWLVASACLLAWRFGEESQQRVPPQVWQVRRCSQRELIFTHSSHSRLCGVFSSSRAAKWAQGMTAMISCATLYVPMYSERESVSDNARVLIVDDNALDRTLLQAHLSSNGSELDFANDGVEAMSMLEQQPLTYDVVLLDRSMPRMNGIEVLTRIKSTPHLRMLPVILQTALTDRPEIVEGIRAGAYYYLTKPYDGQTLSAVVGTAVRDFAEYKELQQRVRLGVECLTLIEHATLRIQTVDQARDTAAVLVNACPDPVSAVIGLTELLVNAVEHGNLGITYEDKTALNSAGTWDQEVRRRLALPENANKRVELNVDRTADELRFTIRDEGPGFSWENYVEVDTRRAFDNHGRGIAIARAMSFDRVEYRGTGNEVVATVKLR